MKTYKSCCCCGNIFGSSSEGGKNVCGDCKAAYNLGYEAGKAEKAEKKAEKET